MYEESIVGDLINFRGLVYSPVNENGVVFLFGKVMEDLNMYIEEIKPGYPDCIARRYTGKGWKKIRIEFEFQSSNFKLHKHDPEFCDVIVCWEHDWKDCPLEVIELRSRIKELENYEINKPDKPGRSNREAGVKPFEKFLSNGTETSINLYSHFKDKVLSFDDTIYQNIGSLFCSFNTPERSFCFARLFKSSIRIRFFTGGKDFEGTTRIQDKWAEYSIKDDTGLDKAISMVRQAYNLIKIAIKNNEPTGLYSKVAMEDEENN